MAWRPQVAWWDGPVQPRPPETIDLDLAAAEDPSDAPPEEGGDEEEGEQGGTEDAEDEGGEGAPDAGDTEMRGEQAEDGSAEDSGSSDSFDPGVSSPAAMRLRSTDAIHAVVCACSAAPSVSVSMASPIPSTNDAS